MKRPCRRLRFCWCLLDGMLHPAELVEDELILALPVVPVSPEAEAVTRDAGQLPRKWPRPARSRAGGPEEEGDSRCRVECCCNNL